MTDKKFDNPEDVYNKFSNKEAEGLVKNDIIKVDFNKKSQNHTKDKFDSNVNDANNTNGSALFYCLRVFGWLFLISGIIFTLIFTFGFLYTNKSFFLAESIYETICGLLLLVFVPKCNSNSLPKKIRYIILFCAFLFCAFLYFIFMNWFIVN